MEKCKKCNSEDIGVSFQPEGLTTSWGRKIDGVEKFMRNDDYFYQDQIKKEHLIYECKTCGYRIAENCKDTL